MFSCELAHSPLGLPPFPRHFSSNLRNFITHLRRGEQAANVTRSLPKTSPASPRPHPNPPPTPPVFSPALVNGLLNYSHRLQGFLLLQMARSTGQAGLQARCFAMETAAMGPIHATGVRKVRGFFISIHPDTFLLSFRLIPRRTKPKAKDDDAIAGLQCPHSGLGARGNAKNTQPQRPGTRRHLQPTSDPAKKQPRSS